MKDPREDAIRWLDEEHRADVRHYSRPILLPAMVQIVAIIGVAVALSLGVVCLVGK